MTEIAHSAPIGLRWDRGLAIWIGVLAFTILCLASRNALPWISAYPASWVPPVANAIDAFSNTVSEIIAPVTRGIANAKVFAAMPQGSHFINVSRGEIAVEKDVIDSLQSGHLAGAYLDVFEREPLDAASPLWDMPNVVVSPHTASHSLGQNEAIFAIFLDNLARFSDGAGLRNDVDNLA